MDIALNMMDRVAGLLSQLLLQPFYFIGILFVIIQYHRQIQMERKLFHTKLHTLIGETWRTFYSGWLIGIIVSAILYVAGITFQADTFLLIWILIGILSVFKVRFIGLQYAAGLLGILHMILHYYPLQSHVPWVQWVIDAVNQLKFSHLLLLVGVLYAMEAIIIRWQGTKMASPSLFQNKRKKLIGGYIFQGFWSVPLFLVIPNPDQELNSWLNWTLPDWWVLFLQLAPLPIMIGFRDMTTSRLPRDKMHRSSGWLLLYSLAVIGLAVATELWFVVGFIAAPSMIILHEWMAWQSKREEARREPVYVRDAKGLKVLGIIPHSPAVKLGLQAGEIIDKVNGVKVRTKEDLYYALRINAAYTKMEIINLEGHTRFVKRANYMGERHQLGIILVPDGQPTFCAEYREVGLFGFMRSNIRKVIEGKKQRRRKMG